MNPELFGLCKNHSGFEVHGFPFWRPNPVGGSADSWPTGFWLGCGVE